MACPVSFHDFILHRGWELPLSQPVMVGSPPAGNGKGRPAGDLFLWLFAYNETRQMRNASASAPETVEHTA